MASELCMDLLSFTTLGKRCGGIPFNSNWWATRFAVTWPGLLALGESPVSFLMVVQAFLLLWPCQQWKRASSSFLCDSHLATA